MYNTYSAISVLNTFQAAIVLRRIKYLRTPLYLMYVTLLNPKMYLRTNLGFLTQMIYKYALDST